MSVLMSVTADNIDSNRNANIQLLNSMTIEPVPDDDNHYKFNEQEDIDPDVNFFQPVNNCTCKYFLPDEFNKSLDSGSPQVFSLLHFNARSLFKNFDAISQFISQLHLEFTVYGFSETWIHNYTPLLFNLDGYSFIHNDRLKSRGGGVGLLIRDSLNIILRPDLNLQADLCESLFIEICLPLKKNIVVGIIYRDPNFSIKQFNDPINDCMEKIQSEIKNVYIMGDFNIDLLKSSYLKNINEFVNIVYDNSLRPLIDKPTRLSNSSTTLIDNIFTNVYDRQVRSGILYNDITDHFPIFQITLDYDLQNYNSSNVIPSRKINDETINSFKSDLSITDWSELQTVTDIDDAYDLFYSKFKNLFDSNFVITQPKRHNPPRKPWITPSILKSINKKKKLFKQYCRKRNQRNKDKFKSFRNILNKILKYSRKQYYTNLLEKNKKNLKKVWMIINDLLGKKKKKTLPPYFMKEGITLTNDELIANELNRYFSNIASDLKSNVTNSKTKKVFTDYLNDQCNKSIFFHPTKENEIIDIVLHMKMSKSCGFDDISSSIVKKIIYYIASPLSHIFNISLVTGKVPSKLKIGKIIPVFKKGDSHLFANYRPITLLPCFSKILERLIYNRLLSHLNNNNLLNDSQYGFRSNHSCDSALIDLHDKLNIKK